MNLSRLKNKKLDKIVEYFIILIPFCLITGPFLSDLLLSFVALYFFFFTKNIQYPNIIKVFLKIFFLFFFIVLISSFLAEDKILSLTNSIFYFRFCLFSVCFYFILSLNKSILNKIFYVLLFCYLILIIDGLYQFYFKVNILGFTLDAQSHGRRVSSFFGDELVYGSYLARFSPLFFGLVFYIFKNTSNNHILIIIFVILLEIAVFISGERTAFLLFNIIIFLMLILLNGYKKIRLSVSILIPILMILLLLIDSPAKYRIVNKTFIDLKPKDYGSEFVIINKQYHEHYLSSYSIFTDNKFFGVGPKNFRVVCKEEKYNFSKLTCSTHPHNTYLQLLSETGIFSFLIIFSIFILINLVFLKHCYLKFFKKKILLNNFEICLFIHFYISLFPLTPSGSFFNNWISIIYFYPLAILLYLLTNKKII